jgi:hypothetical protein
MLGVLPENHIFGYAASLKGMDAFNSFFTRAVVEGLKGGAAHSPKKEISPTDLEGFLKENLYIMSGQRQDPAVFSPVGGGLEAFRNLVLAIVH